MHKVISKHNEIYNSSFKDPLVGNNVLVDFNLVEISIAPPLTCLSDAIVFAAALRRKRERILPSFQHVPVQRSSASSIFIEEPDLNDSCISYFYAHSVFVIFSH